MAKRVLGSEKELAAKIIQYLKHENWKIYQEVPFHNDSADIVVTKGSVIGVIETKKNLGLDLLEQCERWLKHANFVWAGIWSPTKNATRFGKQVAKLYGIGVLEAHESHNDVYQRLDPVFRRKTSDKLFECLRPEMMDGKYGEAGTNNGGRFTPFRATCEALLDVVRANPGIELKAAIASIKRHHYASDAAARVNVRKYIDDGVIKGLTFDRSSGKLCMYATMP